MAIHATRLLVLFTLCLISIIHSLQAYRLLCNVAQEKYLLQNNYHIGRMFGLPITVDLPVDTPVLLQVEESVHFNYSTKEAHSEWAEGPPSGTGAFTLPEDHQAAFVSTYHQFHCIETFAIQLVNTKKTEWAHLQHCLNFLRQIILCRPDLTLEEGDFAERNFTQEKRGAIHTCRNWEITRAVVNANSLAWITILRDGTNSS